MAQVRVLISKRDWNEERQKWPKVHLPLRRHVGIGIFGVKKYSRKNNFFFTLDGQILRRRVAHHYLGLRRKGEAMWGARQRKPEATHSQCRVGCSRIVLQAG